MHPCVCADGDASRRDANARPTGKTRASTLQLADDAFARFRAREQLNPTTGSAECAQRAIDR